MGRPKKRHAKIKIKQSARLVHKNDATRVAKTDTVSRRHVNKAPFIMNDNGLNMRVRIRRKEK